MKAKYTGKTIIELWSDKKLLGVWFLERLLISEILIQDDFVIDLKIIIAKKPDLMFNLWLNLSISGLDHTPNEQTCDSDSAKK